MTDDSDSEQPTCREETTTADILPPEAHDLIEADQERIWETEHSTAYKVTERCRRDGCSGGYKSVKIGGHKIITAQDFKVMAYYIYVSYYNNPRHIPYAVLQSLIDIPNVDKRTREGMATCLRNAAQLGCDDADIDRQKRTKQELFDAVLPDGL